MSENISPTPWKSGGSAVTGSDGFLVCRASDDANARHIVKCVNSHDELVAALKLAIGFWYHDHPNDTHAAQEAYREVKEALAKAEAVTEQE